ncbi:flagellar assembly protein FliW [Saccharothrix violaceirubra]|uniref:Flagellar assembly factor FliW n=1 Tax=Saccharothrix violaceirubra TaxID=413306 RepID=A0A7W7T871_9PSEU|nr:flagellar assembly protein FliW [Saccharothrix violaceirubra]MBB4968348.1 flagellar assembly factor FliW [Saccharothrix violaceirubra]
MSDADTAPVIEFSVPMPGFPEHRRFLLVRTTEDGLLFSLRSVDDPELRFLVVPPAPFFPDYAPEIGAQAVEQLGTVDVSDLLVLLVVTVGESASSATANLLAPIVVDQRTRRAVQVVLTAGDLRAPLLSA